MAIPSRKAILPGTYFVTSATSNRRRLFQVDTNCGLFLQTLQDYREHYLLHGYVLMPDHIHLLLTTKEITLERTMQLIKGGFSHRLASKLPVWQRGFTDHRIRNEKDYRLRLKYIHENPVAARFVERPEDYAYSSVNSKLLLDTYLSG